ncbi:hypothetical protein Tco_1481460 [Tanacetum coccineum]
MHNLFRGGNVTSGTSALQSVEGRSKGGYKVDGAAALIMAINALVCESIIGGGGGSGGDGIGNGDDTGSGGDGICGSGDEYDVSGDGGGVDMARNLSTSTVNGNRIGV